MTADCKDLHKYIDLYLDGKLVELPELESIVVLNIPSWGAGVDLWGKVNILKCFYRYCLKLLTSNYTNLYANSNNNRRF